MARFLRFFLCIGVVVSCQGFLYGQYSVVFAGGTSSSDMAEFSYSVGQVAVMEAFFPDYSFMAGVLQTYVDLSGGVSVEDVDRLDHPDVVVYPNPAIDWINIICPVASPDCPCGFMIFNSMGYLVRQGSLIGKETRIDLGSLVSGLYVLRFSIPGNPAGIYLKIIKK